MTEQGDVRELVQKGEESIAAAAFALRQAHGGRVR